MRAISIPVAPGHERHAPSAGHLLLFAATYLAAVALGQSLAVAPEGNPCLWPASGIYLGTLLCSPPRHWLRIVPVAMLAEIAADIGIFGFPSGSSVLIAIGNTLEATAGASLVRLWCGTPFRFDGLRDALVLIVCAAVVSPAISATIGSVALTGTFQSPLREFWALWWVGDAVGVVLVAPMVVLALQPRPREHDVHWGEAAALTLTMAAVTHYVLSSELPGTYLTTLPIVWAALRFGIPGTTVVMAILTLMTVHYTSAGIGVFAQQTPATAAFQVQLFLGVSGVFALLLVAIMQQRQAAQRELKRAHDDLELRVAERTAALRSSEERLRLAAQVTGFGTYEYDAARHELVFCSRFCAILGLPERATLPYATLLDHVHPDDRACVASTLARALDPLGPGRHEVTYRVVRHDGAVRWLCDTGCTYFDGTPHAPGAVRIIGTVQDITTREEAEQRLRASEERFRSLAQRLAEAQERERHEIACLLHETHAQDLFALQLGLATLRESVRGTAEAERSIAELEALLSRSMRDLKSLSNALRPTALDHLGLVAALERLAEDFARRSGIATSVVARERAPALAERGAIAVFRAVQEALTNVAKHALAEHVAIELACDDDALTLTVTDDGRGISEEDRHKSGSLGLVAMNERLREVGGELSITGRPGAGSRLTLRVPLAHAEPARGGARLRADAQPKRPVAASARTSDSG